MTQPLLDFSGSALFDPRSVVTAPSAHPAARETSALAGVANLPKRGNQNARVLEVIRAAGQEGLSDPEIARLSGFQRATICARRYDLRSLLEPAERRYQHFGRTCTCWRVKR